MTDILPDAKHSNIAGGSSAKRVINCPGSVALAQRMPPSPSSSYADEGTLLHRVIEQYLSGAIDSFEAALGDTEGTAELTEALISEKLVPALATLDTIDPDNAMDYALEAQVSFGPRIPGVFGSVDLIGKIGRRAIVLDWKFGSGVMVRAEENAQGLFYAAAAMRTPALAWAFEDTDEIEIIIVQPPHVDRWVTTFARVGKFERQLSAAIKKALKPNATINPGDHCRWCPAKAICPVLTHEVTRSLKRSVQALDRTAIADYLAKADLVEQWISDLRALAFQTLEAGEEIPGYKLVPKRGTRKWADEAQAVAWAQSEGVEPYEPKMLSPAQLEKMLKPLKIALPDELIVTHSSGLTLAPESDPRPSASILGAQLSATLKTLV
jgi:hypothetical protein